MSLQAGHLLKSIPIVYVQRVFVKFVNIYLYPFIRNMYLLAHLCTIVS